MHRMRPHVNTDPIEAIAILALMVVDMNLQQGINNSLDSKLDNAFNALDDANANNDQSACNVLGSFVNAVEAQRGKKITDDQADALVERANAITNIICPI